MLSAFDRLPNDQQFIGQDPSFVEEMEKIPLVARCDANVMIWGETGTGKELCARAIHYLSPRAKSPFVPVNCGAIPADLVENELFGHEPGAFTNASTSRPGLIHSAEGGTLFLDEITRLPLIAQGKLLRFLQEREYRPIGSAKTYRADVRVLAASNVEPKRAVIEGKLSRSLYYRLNVVPIKLPPLQQRRVDIPLLSRYFLTKYSAKFSKVVSDFSSGAMQVLVLYDWPGNVRELEHVVQRAVLLSKQGVIGRSDIVLPRIENISGKEGFRETKAKVVAKFEKDYITKMLQAHQGNVTRAALAAKKNRRAFWELIRKHGIDVERFRQPG
ncbi:MAG: sigma-54-dependent Fis family transcriptional regulator [Deltaproteobacteria bacterium]|nr:sigma-54-dependent Fis family transcriptional regulator [Deltaproteobacteria bacterium]